MGGRREREREEKGRERGMEGIRQVSRPTGGLRGKGVIPPKMPDVALLSRRQVVIFTPGLPGRTAWPARRPGNRMQRILNHADVINASCNAKCKR